MLAILLLLQVVASPSRAEWQQTADYRIVASLDEAAGLLRGEQVLRYRNGSPDTLRSLAFHLYLNAGRPGSRWPVPDPGFNRVGDVRIDGVPAEVEWPLAPDSSVLRLRLRSPIPPGGAAAVAMRWEAQPAGAASRPGRHFGFGHWYPRVAVYDSRGWDEEPRHPTGASYGEFGTVLVELELAADQVVAATGVPLCGDPGWGAARRLRGGRVTLQRDFYPDPREPAARDFLAGSRGCPVAEPGRKVVVWYAEDVHHFALAMDPEFRYEEGDVFGKPVRVLYRPGSERTWGAALVSGRTESALVWLDELFGPYPWPQITIVERREPGAAAHPMMVTSGGEGGSAQERILHEVGHGYAMGILANDRSRDAWLDDGLTRFQAAWFFESLGRPGGYRALERAVLDWDLDRLSRPVAGPRERFPDSVTHAGMTGERAELFFHQLRRLLGDPTMRRILRAYFARYRFRHVDETALRSVIEEVSGRDAGALFRDWLHQSSRVSYRVHRARRERHDTLWRTTVTVRAGTPARYPAEVRVYAGSDSGTSRLPGRSAEESVVVTTRSEPRRVMIDPDAVSHDWNMLDNQRVFAAPLESRPTERYLGGWFSRRHRRDRLTSAISPTAWFNDGGGWTFGLRIRDDYLDRFAMNEFWVNVSTGWSRRPRTDLDGRVVVRNPIGLVVPGLDHWLEAGLVEGRRVLGVGFRKRGPRVLQPDRPLSWGLAARWLAVGDSAGPYLDPDQWSDAATLELTGSVTLRQPTWEVAVQGTGGRVTDAAPGLARQSYGRLAMAATTRHQLGPVLLRARAFGGATLADRSLPRQRLIFLAGADPHERFGSPFLRSRGALFVRDGLNYHDPGGASVRGLDPAVAGRQAYGLGLELERALYQRPGQGAFRRAAIALFGDGALADGDLDPATGETLRGVADAGVGLRFDHWIGVTRFQTRLDLPFWVSRPELAQQGRSGSRLGWRWAFSFRPSW